MNYLLDTHTFIWSVMDSEKLSPCVREILEDEVNTVFISPLSFWEISSKTRLGKFSFENIDIRHFPNIASQFGFELLPLDGYDCITEFELPLLKEHKDPFDRMLIHSAIRKNLVLLSKDSQFEKYKSAGLQVMW